MLSRRLVVVVPAWDCCSEGQLNTASYADRGELDFETCLSYIVRSCPPQKSGDLLGLVYQRAIMTWLSGVPGAEGIPQMTTLRFKTTNSAKA